MNPNNEKEFKEFLEKFNDDQVGSDAAHISYYNNEIRVSRYKADIEKSRKLREGGKTVAPSGRTFEECDRLAKEEWKLMAEELIELLSYDRNGAQDWYLASLHPHGFTICKGKDEE